MHKTHIFFFLGAEDAAVAVAVLVAEAAAAAALKHCAPTCNAQTSN